MSSERTTDTDALESRGPDAATELDALEHGQGGSLATPRAWLLVRYGDGSRVIDLSEGSDVVIGRARDVAIVLDDTRASRRHARVWRQGSSLFVEDLGSRNGTHVNDSVLRSQQRRLGAGDVIRVGDCEAVVAITTAEPLPSRDNQPAHAQAAASEDPDDGLFVVAEASMNRVFQVARRLALVDTTVLILGETGAGKEVLAREIHVRSGRSRAPFVRVNCPSLPENLLESELFGYEKGAFTGAQRTKIGYFEAAQGGTILLDEIGDLPLHTQIKLLSVLENRCVLRVGATREVPIDVRVVCATHRDLRAEVAAGRFREDLFYRITPFTLKIPPLRERTSEILVLAGLFARRIAREMGLATPVISPEAAARLVHHPWPGNVRELRNTIEHAMVLLEGGVIGTEHLPESIGMPVAIAGAPAPAAAGAMRDQVFDLERASIESALAAEGGNQTRAAQRLGISRRALIYKMHKYSLGR